MHDNEEHEESTPGYLLILAVSLFLLFILLLSLLLISNINF